MYEIELKAHVDDRKAVIKAIQKFAFFKCAVERNDTYFGRLDDGKKIQVRFRKETPFTPQEIPDAVPISSQKSIIFTYKRKEVRIEDGQTFEVNDEKECLLVDDAPFKAFLEDIGFKEVLKKRKLVIDWDFNGATLELCTLDYLGDFLEIEILSDKNDEKTVTETRAKLLKLLAKAGISEDKIEKRYYSEMLNELKNRGEANV